MIRRGVLVSFNSGTYIATVLLDGSLANTIDVATSQAIAAAEMTADRFVAVAFFDDNNPDDAVLVAVWE